MGLGKTVEALCVFGKRTLVVCPTSVLPNWEAELARFRPGLKVCTFHGPSRALDDAADVTLTTYAILRLDEEALCAKRWFQGQTCWQISQPKTHSPICGRRSIGMAPFIMLGVVEGAPIEQTAPQALIYGWVLQFGIALIPYIARRFFLKEENPQLGGSWVSLAGATVGSLFVWASIFIVPARGILYGIGFALYAIALIYPVKELFEITRDGFKKIESA